MGKGSRLRGLRVNTIISNDIIPEGEEKTIKQMKDIGMKEFDVVSSGPNRTQRRRKVRAPKTPKTVVSTTKTKLRVLLRYRRGVGVFKKYTPDKDPNETNHKRVVRQRALRKALQGVK